MTAWLYWALFALAAVLLFAPALCAWLEERADDRDAETWSRMPGATR